MKTSSLETGYRLRSHNSASAPGYTLGIVIGIEAKGPWVRVLWDDGKEMDCLASSLIAADSPWPMHYHRCEWCGVLMECTDGCGQGGKFDPYTDTNNLPEGGERNTDGTFDGGYCDSDCYNHRRPRGCQSHHTEEGKVVDLIAPPF